MARILSPAPLRPYAGGHKEVDLGGATVGQVLSAQTAGFAGRRKHPHNDRDQLRSFVNVHLDDDDIRHLVARDGTAAAAGDRLSIVPLIAGRRL